MPKITPFLWFDEQAEEAAKFYTSIFKDSKIGKISRYGEAGPGKPGSVMVVEFTIEGQQFTALNGGPGHPFTDATSFVVHCENQEDVDRYWDGLLEGGGKPVACGWLTDRYGLSWQVTPNILLKMISDPDPEKSQRVMRRMMEMVKLDIQPLVDAYEGK